MNYVSESDYFIELCESAIAACDHVLSGASGYDDDEKASAKRARHVNLQAVEFAIREGL